MKETNPGVGAWIEAGGAGGHKEGGDTLFKQKIG